MARRVRELHRPASKRRGPGVALGLARPGHRDGARQKLFNDYDLLYPRPYDFEVREAGKRTGFRSTSSTRSSRQESLYRADAGSSAGALGLMQLLPETARLTARRAGLRRPHARSCSFLRSTFRWFRISRRPVERFEGRRHSQRRLTRRPECRARWLPPCRSSWMSGREHPFNEHAHTCNGGLHSLVFAWLDTRAPQRLGMAAQRAPRRDAASWIALAAAELAPLRDEDAVASDSTWAHAARPRSPPRPPGAYANLQLSLVSSSPSSSEP